MSGKIGFGKWLLLKLRDDAELEKIVGYIAFMICIVTFLIFVINKSMNISLTLWSMVYSSFLIGFALMALHGWYREEQGEA